MNRIPLSWKERILYGLLAALGIFCGYMAYSFHAGAAEAAQAPKPRIVCVPKDKAAIGLLTPTTREAWKAERAAAAAKGGKAVKTKAQREKVKR